ncbi:unnamed protein product, partial [Phaeothamnion confervicola]
MGNQPPGRPVRAASSPPRTQVEVSRANTRHRQQRSTRARAHTVQAGAGSSDWYHNPYLLAPPELLYGDGPSASLTPRQQDIDPEVAALHEEVFIKHIKHALDSALKLLSQEGGGGGWIVSGLLRKSGVAGGLVDALVAFVEGRATGLLASLSIKQTARALAKCLRRHLTTREAVDAALARAAADADAARRVCRGVRGSGGNGGGGGGGGGG